MVMNKFIIDVVWLDGLFYDIKSLKESNRVSAHASIQHCMYLKKQDYTFGDTCYSLLQLLSSQNY